VTGSARRKKLFKS